MTAEGTVGEEARPRILATDDRPEVLRLVDRALGERYRCEFAGDVAEARGKLAQGRFDLALCDIQMPGESGLVLVEEIARRQPATAIVLVTGVDDPEIADRAFALGAHNYLVKPFWPGQLAITVATTLRHHRLEREHDARQEALLGSARERSEALRHELIEAQRQAIEELRASRQETVDRLSLAIELHDAETGEHITRMAAVAAFLGERLGLDRERVTLLRTAAPMHDVGKVATPDAILRKRGALNEDERRVMEEHTLVGREILSGSKSELLQLAATIAHTHHERWDGEGYPSGLAGEEIPLEGRIVAVADVFDAMLSDRCYRPALSVRETAETIAAESGTHFDPGVAAALLDNLDQALALRS